MRMQRYVSALWSMLVVGAWIASAQTQPQNAPNLGGTSWQLVGVRGNGGKTLSPEERAKYAIEFGTDGRVTARIDCNQGRSIWTSSGPSRLVLGPLALTHAQCPPGSLHDRMVKDWNLVRSYEIKDSHLFLSLMTKGGIYEFEPIAVGKAPSAGGGQAASAEAESRKVQTDLGVLEGRSSAGVLVFKGVPFAAPPIGNLRWRAPQPVTPWAGVRKATAFGHDCMQLPELGDAASLTTTPSEDCLVLNVWRPARIEPGEKLPVMVWIHGGGYVNGGSSPAIYDGAAFARQGLVFVSFNYRLGRFGFFAHPALIAAKEGPVGNFGYMDQIEALHWVHRNIAVFGGNPDQVTLVGESAGGDSVMHLVTSPQANALFQRAIVMSGDGRSHVLGGFRLTGGTPQEPSADEIGVNFARSVGIASSGPDALQALRALPPVSVLGGLNMSGVLKLPAPLTYVKGPVVDDQIVVGSPGELLRRSKPPRIPIMIGTTSADLAVKFPPSAGNPFSYFRADEKKARAVYNPEGSLPPAVVHMMVGVDMTMHEPARFVAKQMTQSGVPVWLYRFDYVAESLRPRTQRAAHASELPFLFETLDARYGRAATDKDRAAAQAFNAYFVNFAKTGNPNGRGLTGWPKFNPARSNLMMFSPDDGPVVTADPLRHRLDLVERAAAVP